MTKDYGYASQQISSSCLELDYLETAGPRIVGLSYRGSANLFAELPKISVSTPYGDFHYIGGHRLWHSPEAIPRSYIPDNDSLTITEPPGVLILDGKTEAVTGIQKRIDIQMDPEESRLVLKNTLTNQGLWEITLSAWALTMLRLGGTVILQVQPAHPDLDGLRPDRHVSLWPYSHMHDPRLQLGDEFILLHALPNFPAFKIGAFNPQGWMGSSFANLLK
ncbi:MAG: hypothetical protein P4L50_25065 [Anaerolineaceae bacterium]|nr:hypothetical protein [Anaerolineaceae bacterium]